MSRLTTRTEDGRAALKLEDPKTEEEARKQLHDKFLVAVEKLARYEDLEEIHLKTGLKPCPFCGGRNLEIDPYKFLKTGDLRYAVVCDYKNQGCGASTGFCTNIEEAISAWNRRAGE